MAERHHNEPFPPRDANYVFGVARQVIVYGKTLTHVDLVNGPSWELSELEMEDVVARIARLLERNVLLASQITDDASQT